MPTGLFSTSFLFASLIWGTIGVGFCVYGKKQAAGVPLAGGLILVAASYFISSALFMSVVGVALIAGMVWLMRAGY